jgi:hypothetical protein
MLHVLQVCNVGRIVGGTAACAWTATRALSACRHTVAFLGLIADDTRRAFTDDCRLLNWNRVTAPAVDGIAPDVVLLHNTSSSRCDKHLPAVSLMYRHSQSTPVAADLTLYCSGWLAKRSGGEPGQVCLQAVPKPIRPAVGCDSRPLRDQLVIGRICTPQPNKWPNEVAEFYSLLAGRFPQIRWEFIGCPAELQTRLLSACHRRATFWPAAWEARSRLWHWDALLYHNPRVTESFGRTVAEAMRAGCIPVVDDRGGFREQIEEGCGFLCRSPSDFSAAIAALQSVGKRWKMSRDCETHADERFSLARFGQELLKRFREAAAVHENCRTLTAAE